MKELDWSKPHILKIGNEPECLDEISEEVTKLRKKIEPWLTAVFQSENLSLLVGTGLSIAVAKMAKINSPSMGRIEFECDYKNNIKKKAEAEAKNMDRGGANIEDDLRVAIELYKGLLILEGLPEVTETEPQETPPKPQSAILKEQIDEQLSLFINSVLKTEQDFLLSDKKIFALNYLKSFLISFSSRTASRNRLNIFTTNYDRFIEYACDASGILMLDSFAGKINPIFRANKISLDYHYNPPGIRGEPRYVEGVVRYTKLHGSLDWKYNNKQVTKNLVPFGADDANVQFTNKTFDQLVIYPNSAKDIETIYFPYAELFREFSIAVCQPNSVIVTYGYGFGDSHVNRILKDMLTIPSTHIVIISWDDAGGRIQKFVEDKNLSQITLLIGGHFGELSTLVDNYLPKAAIDRISERENYIKKKRGDTPASGDEINPEAENGTW